MMFEAVRRSFAGIAFAGIITFIFLTVFLLTNVNPSVDEIWKNMSGSMLMGIYFGSASVLFDIEKWSPLKQTVIHFLLSVAIWFPLAIMIGWVPIEMIPILIGLAGFILVYTIFWVGLTVYFFKVEKEMNQHLKNS